MSHLKLALPLTLVLSIFLAALPQARNLTVLAQEDETADDSQNEMDDNALEKPKGLSFHLSEGAEQQEHPQRAKLAPAEALSDAEIQNLLKRLPPIKSEATDEQEFALREESLPPPRTGATVKTVFPAPETLAPPETKTSGPLEVLRYAPEGEVPLAPNLNVTFSQPMVAVTSQEEAAESVPVKLSPQPKGRWRWVGTKTLLFEPEGRFPMATQYTATVPAGTKSATAVALAVTKSWTFTTPAPQVQTKYPENGPARRDALIFVSFDQRIDPSAVLRTITVRTGRELLQTRLATAEEVVKDEIINRLAKGAQEGRWLAFRAIDARGGAADALPGDAQITVTIGPGTPSAEGPRTTTKPQQFSFRTYGPLRVVKHECAYDKHCTPFDSWRIEFSNPLDAAVFQKSQVKVEPEVQGLKTSVYGNTLNIDGIKRGRTTYKVTLDHSIRDTFGQTLSRDEALVFNVGPAEQSLFAQGNGFVVLDPNGPATFSVYTINHSSLNLRLYSTRPEDWRAWLDYQRNRQGYGDTKAKAPPGRLVLSKTVAVKSPPDEMVETPFDLSPGLTDGLGQVIVIVEPTARVKPKQRWERDTVEVWVARTNIGLDAFVDNSTLVAWANSLKDGVALAGVEMEIVPGDARSTTGKDGLAQLALPETSGTAPRLLVARHDGDVAILPENQSYWYQQTSWVRKSPVDTLRWYVFDDRKLYRPGEEVHVKGWIRRVGQGQTGDVGPLGDAASVIDYKLKDSRGNEITGGSLKLNALGGFDTVLKLPGTMNLGYAPLELTARDAKVTGAWEIHAFQVQEFRRPEFEVTTQTSEGPHFVGGSANVSVTAAYFAGGGLANADVNWRVTATPGYFTPPNRSDWTFGKWVPWWVEYYGRRETDARTETFKGLTDAAGKHRLRIDFDRADPPRPYNLTAEATIQDVNRQAFASSASMLVHPADLYVGMKSERTFVPQGQPLAVQAIVTDLDGKAVTGREIKMRAARLDWEFENGAWKQKEADEQNCSVKSAGDGVSCRFETKEGGQYRVTATIRDERNRPNESELTLWVAGGKQPPRRQVEQEKVELIPDRKEYRAGDTAEILVEAPFYPAEALLTLRRSGMVRTEHFHLDGPSHTLRVPIEEGWTPNVHVQVDLVGAEARQSLAGSEPPAVAGGLPAPGRQSLSAQRGGEAAEDPRAGALGAGTDAGEPQAGIPALPGALPKRPAFAKGELNLSIPPLSRKLTVAATPRDKALEPSGETSVDVEVRDAVGQPVAASEVAVVVVDESVLALTNYKLVDPLSVFYAQRGGDTSDYHSRASVLLANPEMLVREGGGAAGGVTVLAELSAPKPMAAPLARAGKAGVVSTGEAAEAIHLRENFNALAVFAPSVRTDASGRAQVPVKLPDNLTRYRVMAVAVAGGKQFGSGESAITARLPLMARPSAPRFLNFGDRFELPIVLQNQTDNAMTVDVAVRATNAVVSGFKSQVSSQNPGKEEPETKNLKLETTTGRRVVVPADDRVEVRIPAAAVKAGTARFQIASASGRWSDAAEISLPVWTPATTEAFATYGEIDDGAIAQPVKAPASVFKEFGGLEIETSSTQLQELTDAFLYLQSYPYECSEQLASRILSVAALRDVLTAFKAKDLPPPQEIEAAVERDLKRLQGMQNSDGGFGFWRRGDESWPYLSIHVAHALARAQQKKFDVPADMFNKSKGYLRDIEKHIPSYYGPDARRALIAYALYARAQMRDRDLARARRLIAEAGLENLSLESVGWLLSVLSGDAGSQTEVQAIRRLLNNRATETAATAHFASSYKDADYLLLNSDRRGDGVILEALIGDQPNNDLIPKIVRGLLDHRTRGRWENTQENVFILLALNHYFNTFEKVTPDFVARVWLGDAYAGQQQFKGRATDRQQVNVAMRYLAEKDTQNLFVDKEGPGRLYYRIGMQYAPFDLNLKPAEFGFTVERAYQAVDDPKDVRRDADGGWRIRAGARVRVRLTMVAPARRYHVALVDPMPAGFESLNPALAVTESIPEDKKQTGVAEFGSRSFGFGWWWWRPVWFDHQNLRDERAEAFASLLWEGVYHYSYVARATTPGVFVVPPAKAEEMYHPETFGRGKTDRVTIE